MTAPILFADFQPGQKLGEHAESLGRKTLEQWVALYPWDPAADQFAPLGFATLFLMRAYLTVVAPRPAGNLHVQQTFSVHDRIRIDETVTTTISCLTKELKNSRRKIELSAEGCGSDGRDVFSGVITLYWAA
jgi:hypothetical protein